MEESYSSTAKKVAQRMAYSPMEPIEKRRRLARYLTSLASATFWTKRERGDRGL